MAVHANDYEGRPDPGLLALVPDTLRVVRARAWSPDWTRLVGVGDLGLRGFSGLLRSCRTLSGSEKFDCFFVTIYPSYPALLGPLLKRGAGLPFVLDYQDPWVGAWGLSTGPGPNGAPDVKSRVSRFVASRLEPLAVRAADALTAVSRGTYDAVLERNGTASPKRCAEIPLGGEPRDFEHLREHPRPNPYFESADGNFHLVYVGTLLPKGLGTLRAVLKAVSLVKDRRPDTYQRVRLHFFGTSNQSSGGPAPRVLPEAKRLGVGDVVDEIPLRIDYLDALTVLTQSSGVLLMGSSERHYTASKLYPALLSKRPLLAVYHEESSVVSTMRRVAPPPWGRLVTYDDERPAESSVESLYREFRALVEGATPDPGALDVEALESFSARAMARRLAGVLDTVVAS